MVDASGVGRVADTRPVRARRIDGRFRISVGERKRVMRGGIDEESA
jgi:hypothetical protein